MFARTPQSSTAVLLVTAAFALSACTTSPETSATEAAPDSGLRVVVAPMNLAVKAPDEVSDGDDRVWHEILDYFQSRGGDVAVLSRESADRLWRTALSDLDVTRRQGALIVARGRFAQELAEHYDFDLLVLPSLVLRSGRLHGDYATWDGVRRRVPDHATASSRTFDHVLGSGTFLQSNGLHGKVAGASLHVSVLRSDGSAAFEGIGGLDVVQEIQREHSGTGATVFATRDDPFSEPGNLREGVARAFDHQLLATAQDR
jgi:hypothetical protein